MVPKLKILFVEDVPSDVELAKQTLSKEDLTFISRVVETEHDFIREIKEFVPDIIISDYSMPQFNGMIALKIAIEICAQTPFILLTGSINEEIAVECIKSGATDYIIKEHIARLPLAVKEAIERKKNQSEKEKAEKALFDSEAKLRMILENINEIVYTTTQIAPDSPYGVADFVSNRSESIVGVKSEEFIQKPDLWFSLIHPNDINQLNVENSTIFDKKQSGMRKYRMLNKRTGNYIWIEDFVVPKLDAQNNVVGTFGVARDITEQKLADDALLHNINELQHFYNLTVGRELTMIELKKEINELLKKLGLKEKYVIFK